MSSNTVAPEPLTSIWEQHWRAQLEHGFDVAEHEWREAERKAMSWVKSLELPAGATIVDVCCGRGLEVIELARMGFDAVGVDSSPSVVEIANRLASSRSSPARFLNGDARSLEIGQADLVGCRDGVLGGFTPASEQLAAVKALLACLRPGGLLLLDYHDRGYAMAYGVEGRLLYDVSLDAFVESKPGGQACVLLDFSDLVLAAQGLGATLERHRVFTRQTEPRAYVHTAVFKKSPTF